ncbi:unnamed protein product [Ilex paraguariensis]|uniref:Uncharacterized protein n=1 Tax=Ilex paraguariensis TaxID=185542 RepID=A0ABC8QLJ9_9AQUA
MASKKARVGISARGDKSLIDDCLRDKTTFPSLQTNDRCYHYFSSRPIGLERAWILKEFLGIGVVKIVQANGWDGSLKKLGKKATLLIREFYVNAETIDDKSFRTSVRGISFVVDSSMISLLIELELISEPFFTSTTLYDMQVVPRELTRNPHFEYVKGEGMMFRQMTKRYKILHRNLVVFLFLLAPERHIFTNRDRFYALRTGQIVYGLGRGSDGGGVKEATLLRFKRCGSYF